MKKKINILFIGINNFSIPFIKKIKKENKFNIKCIIYKNNNIYINNKIIYFKIDKQEKFIKIKKKIIDMNIHIGILISYGIKIPKYIYKIPKFGIINIHASLLPKWRGCAPIYWSLLNNDKTTGLTIIKINNKIDHGKIIYQKKIKINKNDNYKTIFNKIKNIGCRIIKIIILKIINNKINYINQNKKYITYSKKITKKDGLISWKNNTYKEIKNKIKAFYIWPKTYFFYKNNIIFLWSIKKIKNNFNNIPGKILKYNKKELIICCKDKPIKIKKIQLNNKKKNKIHEIYYNEPSLFTEGNILN